MRLSFFFTMMGDEQKYFFHSFEKLWKYGKMCFRVPTLTERIDVTIQPTQTIVLMTIYCDLLPWFPYQFTLIIPTGKMPALIKFFVLRIVCKQEKHYCEQIINQTRNCLITLFILKHWLKFCKSFLGVDVARIKFVFLKLLTKKVVKRSFDFCHGSVLS